MKNIILFLSLSLLISFNASSQDEQINIEAINNYKYVIIPLKFEVLSEVDQYQINSLTKFLFNKYGYAAFLENDSFPEDLRQNGCLALKADVIKVKGGFLSTRLKINLMDCNGQLVVSSKVGKTREKEFKTAYNLAVRNAFQSFQFHNYKYKPNPNAAIVTSSTTSLVKPNVEDTKVAQEEIERLKQEVASLKEEKEVNKTVIVPVAETSINNKKIIKSTALKTNVSILYAQPIDNGFQVVDKTPKVIMILLVTPKENTFIVKDQNAIVYKEDGFWYLSKNDGNVTSLERLNIKF
ncbi:hypothetical protein [Psychroserpens ponticola]|uniref:Uncharacterized protein n=1 Tax=Psychroserpens ponticola TaxID=2932268 RepID=A0ABY7RYX4_9FLAO|nr:hypothetical protein [Psychroserpens ponticola]WCO02335.1 hypothetical protein MUN68_002320 [Psychroserpens ponticola]